MTAVGSAGRRPRRLGEVAAWLRPAHFLWVVLGLLIGLPLLSLVAVSLNTGDPTDTIPRSLGLSNYLRLGNRSAWLVDTLSIAFGVTVLTTAVGVVLAWVISRTAIRGKGLLTLLIILPYPMGPMVIGLSWATLGSPENGLLNAWIGALTGADSLVNTYSMGGVIVVQSLFQVPVTFMLVQAALRNMDPALEESSDVLGAGRFKTAVRITIPVMLPAVIGSALFAFVSALGAFAIPTVLGRNAGLKVATNEVYLLVSGYPRDYPLAAVIGLVMIAITAVAIVLTGRVLRRRSHAVVGGKSNQARLVDMGRWRYPLALGVYGYIVLAVVLPLTALFIASMQQGNFLDPSAVTWTFKNYVYVLVEYPATRLAVTNSLGIGVATGVIGATLAAMVAVVVERARRAGRQMRLMEQLTMAPQAVPRIVFSMPLLWLILLSPVQIYGTVFAVLIAYVIVFLPLAYRGIAGVVAQAHPSLEEAARTLGASPAKATRSITVPLLRSGLFAAAALLFMISVSEVGASILLSSTNSRVLGPMMFSFYDSGGLSLVSALAMVQTVIVLSVLLVLRKVTRRVMGT